jgi:WD40 repeat protein
VVFYQGEIPLRKFSALSPPHGRRDERRSLMAALARRVLPLALVLLFSKEVPAAVAPPALLPGGDREPVLRIEAGGPTADVTALVFSADGKTLYAAGWDKVVRVWTVNARGVFEPDLVSAYRVPVGPGLDGAINALALSDDGLWLAAGGKGVVRHTTGFRGVGLWLPYASLLTDTMREDMGTITVFNTRDQTARLLRGHHGSVHALAFAPTRKGQPPQLISVARERAGRTDRFSLALRLWDVEGGKTLARHTGLPVREGPLGVAVWNAGPRAEDVRVALALNDPMDGKLRLWDPLRDEKSIEELSDRPNNVTVAHWPGSRNCVTAGSGAGAGRLRLWTPEEDGTLSPGPLRRLPEGAQLDSYPRALGLLSRRGDGGVDLAATVVRRVRGREALPPEYRLQVLDSDSNRLADLPLWRSPREPVLAAAPRGRFVAIAGAAEPIIHVYALDALLAGKKVAPQVLRSRGVTFRHVAFVRRGKEQGLLLNTEARRERGQPAPAPDRTKKDRIFAFTERDWASGVAPWKSASPPLGEWRVQSDEKGLRVLRGGKQHGPLIRLPARQRVSDYALLPPAPGRESPLLALATHELEQPQFALYDVGTGRALRYFIGHAARITAVAFSEYGRLLASVGQDQTVCVWSLTTLDEVQFGVLPGVGVDRKGDQLVVERIEEGSPAEGRLAVGDVVLGLVEGKELRRLESRLQFYQAVRATRAGERVTLRLRRGGAERDVPLGVARGADERNPLFSLFVLPGGKDGKNDWIGWHPLGPYDAGSARAERSLGWHFNTGDPRRPARFAPAHELRKENYRKGLLDELIRKGRLVVGPPPPPPPPRIDVRIDEGRVQRVLEGAETVVRQLDVRLRVEVSGRPLSTLAELTWKVDDEPEVKLDLDHPDDEPFVVPLKLARGKHRVVVTARPREAPSKSYPEGLALVFAPLPPRIKYDGRMDPTIKKGPFDLRFQVFSRFPGEDVHVSVRHLHDSKVLFEQGKAYAVEAGSPVEVRHSLDLRLGKNAVEVRAVNKGALPDRDEKETVRLDLVVDRTEKDEAPLLSFDGLMVPGAGGKEELLDVDAPDPAEVRVPRVTLAGKVSARAGKLLALEMLLPGAARGVPLRGFVADREALFRFREPLELKPGVQTYRFRARTVTSADADRSVKIAYRPPVPQLTLTEPRWGTVINGETPTAEVPVRGKIAFPDHSRDHPSRRVLLIDDAEHGEVTVEERAGTWTAKAKVAPGAHRLRVRASNEHDTSVASEETLIHYQRPPRIVELKQGKGAGKPIVDLEARVRSPLPLIGQSVRVEVNGRESTPTGARSEQAGDEHVLRLEGVALDADRKENEVRVWVSNAEARSLEPKALTVRMDRLLPAPEVHFVTPDKDVRLSARQVTVRLEARSLSPLRKVLLVQEWQAPVAVDLKGARRGPDGYYQVVHEVEVPLRRGLNSLHLEAVNDSGRVSSPALVINCVPPPVEVVFDRLVEKKSGGRSVAPVRLPRGRIAFPEVDGALVLLQGRLVWDDAKTAGEQKHLLVPVNVNGFQVLARIAPLAPGKLEAPFEASFLLNRRKDNRVQVEVSGQESQARFEVDCRQPNRRQRLHLLILSAQPRDAAAVQKEVLGMIHSQDAARRLRTPAFEDVLVHKVLIASQVREVYIRKFLRAIRDTVVKLARAEPLMNDVIMIYYEGGEAVEKDGNFFQTDGGRRGARQFDVACDKLVAELAQTPGAHVLLLDVDRARRPLDGVDKIADWNRYYLHQHMVVMRHAWKGKEAAPPGARLLAVLREAIPRAARLSEVVTQMSMLTLTQGPDLLVDRYFPPELEDLNLGREP